MMMLTDGITEVRVDEEGGMLGWDGVAAMFRKHWKTAAASGQHRPPTAIADAMFEEASLLSTSVREPNDNGLQDDLALLVVAVREDRHRANRGAMGTLDSARALYRGTST